MAAALALVWVAPRRRKTKRPENDNDFSRPGNGKPAPPTILVVEDDVLARLRVCDHLRHSGYRVIEVSRGEEAQAIFRAGELVELLLSDIDLGEGISGIVLAKWVREHYPDVRIILASGVETPGTEGGGLTFLPKPHSPDQLLDHVKRLLGALGRQAG